MVTILFNLAWVNLKSFEFWQLLVSFFFGCSMWPSCCSVWFMECKLGEVKKRGLWFCKLCGYILHDCFVGLWMNSLSWFMWSLWFLFGFASWVCWWFSISSNLEFCNEFTCYLSFGSDIEREIQILLVSEKELAKVLWLVVQDH